MAKRMIQKIPFQEIIAGGYLLRLGNGRGWHLKYTLGAKAELEELVRIMGLESYEPNGYPKLIFVKRQSGKRKGNEPTFGLDRNLKEYLRGLGWVARDLMLLRFWSHDEVPDLLCEMRHEAGDYEQSILNMRFSLYPIYQRAQDLGGIPLHAGLVERDGKGILLAGPRNTGKSTCCRRLPSPWLSLCDEESLIIIDKQKRYLVHPFPTWSDYLRRSCRRTWNVNSYVPLTSIFLLEQASTDEVIPLGAGEATAFINHLALQVCYRYWGDLDPMEIRSRRKNLLENICGLVKAVPAFKLRVSLTGRFWEKIEAVIL